MPKLTGPSGRPWVLSEVRLQESILAEGSRATVLKARIVERAGDRYPVVLPQGARLEAVRVNGKWLDLHEGGDSATLDIPVSLRLPCDFEIEYRSETVPGWVVRRADSPLPDMPGELGDIRRTWNLDSHWVAWPWAENGVLAGSGPTLWVLPGDWLRAAGWCLGLVLAGGLWVRSWPNRESRSVRQPAWVAGGFCGLALLLPSGWAMVLEPGSILAGVFLIVQLIRTSRQPLSEEAPSQRSASRVKLAAGAMVLTLTLLCHSEWIRGQALPRSAPVAVYYTPGPANAPESWTVLAPESLLTKLDSLSRSPLPALTLASAEYEGTSANATATFEARYLVDCNREGDQTLNLPLGGVRLESAKLDGLNAYPDATKPDRLAIPIRGVGQHELVLRFAATPQANGADREVRFTVPDLPACKVNFTAGLRGRQLQVPTRRGGQTLRLTANGLRAEVDHGSGSEIAIRWREGVAEGTKPTVVVREASVWDLDESTATLTAAFLHRVEGGTVDRLRIECPETLEPGRLIVRSLDPRASNIGIRDWQVGPPIKGWRTLELRLQGPTDGQFLVILRGYPLKVASLRPALRFPRTNATAEIESFHAVRYNGIAADSIALVNAIDFPAEPVLKEFASVTELGFEKNPPARVVRRVSEGNSELRPVLLPPSLLQQTAGEVAFTVGRRVEIEGAMRGTGKDLSWLEFDLPPAIRVHEVRATGLLGWSRIGSRVQVWGQGPANEWLVRWTGSLAVDLAPDERPQTAPAQVDCPLPRWIVPAGVSQEPLVVRVRPTEGWSVQFPPASGVRPRSDSVSPGEQVFLVEGPQISQMKALVNWQPRATPPAGPRPPKGDSGPAPIEPPVASPVPPPLASVAGSARNEFHSLPARVARTAAWSLAVLTLAWFVRRNPRRWTPELIVAVAALLMLACAPWSHAWWLFLLLALAALFARGLSLGFRALQSLFRETGS
jgi:hypothetical protein